EISISDPLKKTAAKIVFRASVTEAAGGKHRFDYSVTSSANDKVLVYWYVPLTEDFSSLEMTRDHPLTAAPNDTVHKSAVSGDPVGWSAATVQVFDFDRRWLATGTASVYSSLKGQAEKPLEPASGKQARDNR